MIEYGPINDKQTPWGQMQEEVMRLRRAKRRAEQTLATMLEIRKRPYSDEWTPDLESIAFEFLLNAYEEGRDGV